MFTVRHQLEMLFIITVTTFLGLIVLMRTRQDRPPVFAAPIPIAVDILQSPTPTPTLIPKNTLEIFSYDSSDGQSTLYVDKLKTDKSITFTFFTADTNQAKKLIFSQTFTLPEIPVISVSDNAWSPDNAYFFIKENTKNVISYEVFAKTKDANSSSFVDVSGLFNVKVPKYIISEVTGWAAPNLLIVNTLTKDGTQGPSFWFDLTTKSFIQLATHFG